MSVNLASRRVGRVVQIAGGGGTQLISFGPFVPGEVVDSFTLFLTFTAAMTSQGVYILVDITATPALPATVAIALVQGRLLTTGSPRLPVGNSGPDGIAVTGGPMSLGPAILLPVGWMATDKERWLSVVLNDASELGLTGSCWLRSGPSQKLEVESKVQA